MASTSGTGSASAASLLGITGKGIGGLATGLDTDSLVSALTSGTQSKIAKQGQQKQLLNWKISAYRTMTSALNAFQSKFLKRNTSSTASSITDITQSDFFNTYKATSSSSKVSVSATSTSTAGNFTIEKVKQLAEAEKYTSVKTLSTTLSSGVNAGDGSTFEKDFTGQTLKLEVDGFTTKTIKLDDLNNYLAKDANGALKKNADGKYYIEDGKLADFQAGLQTLLDKTYGTKTDGTKIVQVSLDGPDGLSGNIMLSSDSAKITVNTKNDLLGLAAGDTNRVNTSTKIGMIDAFNGVQGNTLTFKINNVEISVNKDDTLNTLMTKINNSTAGVRMEYDKFKDVFTLTSKTTGAGSNIEISDTHGNLMNELFGVKGGSGIGTGTLTTGDSVTSLDIGTLDNIKNMTPEDKKKLANSLSNMSFSMTINGVNKSVKLDTASISSLLTSGTFTSDNIYSAINKGIQNSFFNSGVTFSKGEDGRTVIKSAKGEAFSLTASGEFAKMTGINSTGGSTTLGNIIDDYGYNKTISTKDGNITPESLGLTPQYPTASFEMTINGVTKTVTVSLDERNPTEQEKEDDPDYATKKYYSAINGETFVPRLNQAIKTAFGSDAANVKFTATYVYNYKTTKDIDGLGDSEFVIDAADPLNSVLKKGDEVIGNITKDLGDGMYLLEYTDAENNPQTAVIDKDGYLLNNNGKQMSNGVKEFKLTLDSGDTGKAVTTSVSISGSFIENLGFKVDEVDGVKQPVNNATAAAGVTLGELKGGYSIDNDGNKNPIADGTLTLGNGQKVTYTSETTLKDLLTSLNNALGDTGDAGIKDGKLYINSTSDTLRIRDSGGLLEGVFGITGGKYVTAAAGSMNHTEGKNAEIVIDGKVLAFSSNNITHNNVNITLNEESDEAIKIGVQSDPEDVISRIKDWMTDYNALIYTLNSAINEGKKSDYAPLTDEQKSQMTDEQVKTWETEAKKGLLRNDQTLRGILQDMRSAFTQKVEAAGISLFDIGIVTKSGYGDSNEAGQLEFDKNVTGGGEQRLRQMLTDNPDKVRLLFTDENGIGARLNSVITNAASTSSVSRGSLVRIAGTEQLTGDNTSQLGDKISQIDKYIASLKSRMESEYTRYWKKFSALELSVNKMNSQSSWLQSQ